MKKLNSKAFTLIELLAVILILGIIALIAIPTVTNIIQDSKRQSYIRSAEGLLSSVDTKINIDMLKGLDINAAYNFKNNKLLNGELDLKGNMPKEGKIRVNNDGEVALAIVYDNYCITKSFDSDEISAINLDENGCNLLGNISILKSYAYNAGIEIGWINYEQVYYIPEYRNNIISINFLYQESVPTNALVSWDVSDAQDESIMAYLMPNGTKYDLYIISENNIYAPVYPFAMFQEFGSIQEINFHNFDTSNVKETYLMFSQCINLKKLDLSGFDTRNITNMSYMFLRCSSAETMNVSSFDTSNVTNMAGMFQNCESLKELDISNFDTNKVNSMSHMFFISSNLSTIYIGENWKMASNAENMFTGCDTDTLTTKI